MIRWILRSHAAAFAGCPILFAALHVSAQTSAGLDDPDPIAIALFRQGRELVAGGDWQAGCEKLAQSGARKASPSTMLNLARCDEHAGKMASAWARDYQAMAMATALPDGPRRDELVLIARGAIARLEPQLPKLRITPHPSSSTFRVVDETGRVVPTGEDVPLDPGPHTLKAEAAGYATSTSQVELSLGRTIVLDITLAREPELAAAAPAHTEDSNAPRPSDRGGSSTTRAVPWVPVALGALGLGLGAAAIGFAVDSTHAYDALKARCGGGLHCTDPSFDPSDLNARKDRGLGLAVGLGSAAAVSLGTAAWLLFARHRGAERPLKVRPGHAGARFAVEF